MLGYSDLSCRHALSPGRFFSRCMLRKSSQNRDSLKKPFLNHTGVKLLIGIPSFRWRYGKRCGQIDHIFLLRNWKINVLPFSLHGFPAPFRRRFPALPLGGLSPGIPCRRSCGFQGPTGKTATKKPSQNRPALPSLFLEGHASRLCNG